MDVGKALRTTVWLGLVALVATVGVSSLANAAVGAGRTFVASTGNDSNTVTNCASSAPCRSFSAAYGVTTVGGEIVALDSAGFGTLTVSNSVSIIGAQGGASISVTTSGTTGIIINAGSGGTVILKNLEINGGGVSNTGGIALNSGHLILENSTVKLLTIGLNISNSKADIIDSNIIANTIGIQTTGTGADVGNGSVPSAGGPTEARLKGGTVVGNTTAFLMQNPGTTTAGGTANNITILFWQNGGTSTSMTTYVAGNGTETSGNGTGCTVVNNCTAAAGFLITPTSEQN
ncbi:MAG TPA: hypothetical protein VGP48_00470 [Stellaceae bacterium]|jgi:hypothetical protein|nr:hypothetical protein [Stellaceae bacterium]